MLGFPYEERLLRLPRLQGGSFGHTVLWHWLCGLRKGLWHCWTSRSMEIGCDGVSHWSAKLKRNGVTQKTKKKARQGPGKILFSELKVCTKLSHYSQVYYIFFHKNSNWLWHRVRSLKTLQPKKSKAGPDYLFLGGWDKIQKVGSFFSHL